MSETLKLRDVTLDDKYIQDQGTVFISGTQALTKLPLLQRALDVKAGLNTAGYISGYRGSPLGAYDLALWGARDHLLKHHIHFQPGVNEDLAATAIWGTQQFDMLPGANYDGVFSIWYGKGPGVDRSGDVFKHANIAGTHQHGGVLLVMGDDHPGKSSTVAHQSEHAVSAASIPVLYPASPQEFIDMGLMGWAMSRHTGCWVGLKTVNETIENTATVSLDLDGVNFVVDQSLNSSDDNVKENSAVDNNIDATRFDVAGDDIRLQREKLPKVKAFARANKIDKVMLASTEAKIGIVAAGKSYLDVMQALQLVGLDAVNGPVKVYKPGLIFPMEPEQLTLFAEGLQELLVVEEKKAFMEPQIANILFNVADAKRPQLTGKLDQLGSIQQPSDIQLQPLTIAELIVHRLKLSGVSLEASDQRLAALRQEEQQPDTAEGAAIARIPYFCAGCPHNTSTRVPDGSMALSGIGCHTMAIWMDRDTTPPTQMGGEGLNWTGMAPFTKTDHVFQNLGDGTYYHSGFLAIRGAINAGVNVTFKILFNDAVAMTGGQPLDGELSVDKISRQVLAEGAVQVVIVTDEPEKYPRGMDFGADVTIRHRDELNQVQEQLRQVKGTTVLIYDQVCAAEKRRRRKRGLLADPDKRVIINPAVCEGCGDCSVQSNCVAIVPLETAKGRKRAIDQSACNKDFSCLNGFCPAMVTVTGAKIRMPARKAVSTDQFADLPEPETVAAANILITGIGGTGVVTIGAVLGMAAHLEEKSASVFDMTGLAQKGGAVLSHLKISKAQDKQQTARIGLGEADLILGCDLVVSGGPDALMAVKWQHTRAIVNSSLVPTAAFQMDNNIDFDQAGFTQRLKDSVGDKRVDFINANFYALKLLGNTMAANMFMVGYALQKGFLPVSLTALVKAIELNGVAIDFNKEALNLGRLAANDITAMHSLVESAPTQVEQSEQQAEVSLDSLIAAAVDEVRQYGGATYAANYNRRVLAMRKKEQQINAGSELLTRLVATNLARVMCYKDEYAVAAMHTSTDFEDYLNENFEANYRLNYHMAPPLIAGKDQQGRLKKMQFGDWFTPLLKVLAKFKFIRGTKLDPFSYTADRKLDVEILRCYELSLDIIETELEVDNFQNAIELANIVDSVRGYGHVKENNYQKVESRWGQLMNDLNAQPVTVVDNNYVELIPTSNLNE
ncbi:MAG: indolepyruvate ferredoxin oxidoreductase family protein [Pseudomonadales bacterium]|nr:indolepyruvate ferredoxin oxidoreductase family protein [Pseudomonadales bacterium]